MELLTLSNKGEGISSDSTVNMMNKKHDNGGKVDNSNRDNKNGINNNNNKMKRTGKSRARYEEYLKRDELERQVKNGTLFEGTLHVNQHNRREAYVVLNAKYDISSLLEKEMENGNVEIESDILIEGEVNRNRAFDSDRVGVSILDCSKWRRREKTDMANPQRQYNHVQITGKIVAVKNIEARRQRLFTGYLQSIRESGPIFPRDKSAIFIPVDVRVPRMLVHIDASSPLPTQDNSLDYSQEFFAVSFVRWTCSSVLPVGRVIKYIGRSGDLHAEMKCIEIENSIISESFSDAVLESIKEIENSSITQQEINRRCDLRKTHRVFTVDPDGAKDLDDAISIRCLSPSSSGFDEVTSSSALFEIGIHIADVSHFVRYGSMLDREVRLRSTSTYLVNRVIPMLPTPISDNLCSLKSGEDRLTLSMFVIVDENGNIVERDQHTVWIGKTVIHSCATLSYEMAQRMIDGNLDDTNQLKEDDDQLATALLDDLRTLDTITTNMRRKRLSHGFLTMGHSKLRFQFNEDKHPSNVQMVKQQRTHILVEELMLLANYQVARKFISTPDLCECTLLRKHSEPPLRRKQELFAFCQKHDIGMSQEFSTTEISRVAVQLNESNPELACLFRHQVMKMFSHAEYICVNAHTQKDQAKSDSLLHQEWHHFGLNLPYYTHFTSPIRRYADLMIHRLLSWHLQRNEELPPKEDIAKPAFLNMEYQKAIIEHCNDRWLKAKRAEEQSIITTLLVMLDLQDNDTMEVEALVLGSSNKSLSLYIPLFDMEQRVYLNQELKDQCSQIRHDKNKKVLHISWKYLPEKCPSDRRLRYFNMVSINQTLRPADRVRVTISVKMDPAKPWREFKVSLIKPPPPEGLNERPLIFEPPGANTSKESPISEPEDISLFSL